MKKSIKVISTLLLAIMLVTSIAGTVLAVDPNTVLNGLNGNGNVQTNDLTKVGNNIVTIIQVVDMMGSASEKAEYKKTMIPYIVGAVLIFAGTSLVRVIYSLSTSVSTK